MTETEAKKLLGAVSKATADAVATYEESLRLHTETVAKAKSKRGQAIKDAMEAGIPRKQIADAAGVTVARLYQLTE